MNVSIIVVLIALVVIAVSLIMIYNKKKAIALEDSRLKASEAIAKRQAIKEKEEADFKQEYEKLVEQYGKVTASFDLGYDFLNISNYLYVFEQSSMICLKGEIIPFSKIMGFRLNDDTETIMHNESSYSSVTKTDTGSMIGRAVVGGILFGDVGAVAGANTAKKETITKPTVNQASSTMLHNYSLFVNIDDLSNPLREIKLGFDTKRAQTIANIFNIIVHRNNK